MVVGRGNDAIPTWSGFNYQGKMMLLYVLELINQIVKDKNKDIDAYSVELEKTAVAGLANLTGPADCSLDPGGKPSGSEKNG